MALQGLRSGPILDITYYQELAQRAEAHKFDAIFFADGPALADSIRYAQRYRLEPITWLAAIRMTAFYDGFTLPDYLK